jgi:hypothetical protein
VVPWGSDERFKVGAYAEQKHGSIKTWEHRTGVMTNTSEAEEGSQLP